MILKIVSIHLIVILLSIFLLLTNILLQIIPNHILIATRRAAGNTHNATPNPTVITALKEKAITNIHIQRILQPNIIVLHLHFLLLSVIKHSCHPLLRLLKVLEEHLVDVAVVVGLHDYNVVVFSI